MKKYQLLLTGFLFYYTFNYSNVLVHVTFSKAVA